MNDNLQSEVSLHDADQCCVWRIGQHIHLVWTDSEHAGHKAVAGFILRWIKLTSSGRMSVTAGMPLFVYIMSPLEARRCPREVPPTADMTLCPAPLPSSHQHELTELWLNFPAQSSTFLMQSILFKPNLYFISQPCHLTQAHVDKF